MRISGAFPSDYLKAADLQGQSVKVVMAHVEMKDIGGDHKPILFFQGKDKGMVLNKTNANNISAAYGDDTDDWAGKELVLFEAMVDFQGKTVAAIRVRTPQAKDRAPQRQTGGVSDNLPRDEIPF
jgi:arabinogalactan endo-1,4-beta-galactosidase